MEEWKKLCPQNLAEKEGNRSRLTHNAKEFSREEKEKSGVIIDL